MAGLCLEVEWPRFGAALPDAAADPDDDDGEDDAAVVESLLWILVKLSRL